MGVSSRPSQTGARWIPTSGLIRKVNPGHASKAGKRSAACLRRAPRDGFTASLEDTPTPHQPARNHHTKVRKTQKFLSLLPSMATSGKILFIRPYDSSKRSRVFAVPRGGSSGHVRHSEFRDTPLHHRHH